MVWIKMEEGMSKVLRVGDRVLLELPDPRGNYWPNVLHEGKVWEFKEHQRVVVNIGGMAMPKPEHLVTVWVGSLVW